MPLNTESNVRYGITYQKPDELHPTVECVWGVDWMISALQTIKGHGFPIIAVAIAEVGQPDIEGACVKKHVEKNASNCPCKFACESGGDWVPYGNSGAHLPTYFECNHPTVDTDEWMELEDGCEKCPHYVPDPDYDAEQQNAMMLCEWEEELSERDMEGEP